MNQTDTIDSPERVARFLRARCGAGIEDVRPLGTDERSTAYSFRHDGGCFVARFGAFYDGFAKDRLAAAFSSVALPIPRVWS